MAVECESTKEELSKYRLLYGDLDVTEATSAITNSSHMHEAEVKVHLRLMEEEATLLSRRIVELEVENRGLKAEMNEMQDRIGLGQEEKDKVTVEDDEETKKDSVHLDDVSQNPGEELIRVERNVLEEDQHSSDNEEFSKKVSCEQSCILNQKDLDDFIAVRDQAMLVRSIIHFLIPPGNNGCLPILNHELIPSVPVLSNMETDSQCLSNSWAVNPMLNPLTNGLEVLQTQLRTIVAKVEVLVNSVPSHPATYLYCKNVSETTIRDAKQCPDEKMICHPRSNNEQTCNLDSLELLTSQLHWILQQWHQGKKSTEECVSEVKLFAFCAYEQGTVNALI